MTIIYIISLFIRTLKYNAVHKYTVLNTVIHNIKYTVLNTRWYYQKLRDLLYPVGNTGHPSLCMAVLRHSAYNKCGPLYPVAFAFSPLTKVHLVDQPISAHMDGSSIPVDQPISACMDGSSIEGAACCGQWSVETKFQLYQTSWPQWLSV